MSLNLVPIKDEPKSKVFNYASQVEAAYQDSRVFYAVPVGVEYAHYGENKILSFVFEFGHIRGLLPVHEAGEPIFPLRIKNKHSGDSLWSYLALSKKEKRYIEFRMASLLNSGCPLPLLVISLSDSVAILTRRRAMDQLSESVDLEVDQIITVRVLLTTPLGAWCACKGVNIYIPRHEVYYGYAHPSDVLSSGLSYDAKVIRLSEGDNNIIHASTRVLEPDPWLSFCCAKGSIRRAKIIRVLKSGRSNIFTVEFAPGIFGVAEGVPLTSYCLEQLVTVRITKFIREGYLLRGLIIGD